MTANASELSLFANDPVRRLFASVGILRQGKIRYSILVPMIVAIGWFVPFVLAAIEGHLRNPDARLAFLMDINLPIQTAAVVFLCLAEQFIDEHIRHAGLIFESSGILEQSEDYRSAEAKTAKLRMMILPDVVALLIACLFDLAWIVPALHQGAGSWMLKTAGGHTTFTLAGWWCALVFGPILQFAFVRWAWKFFIWVYFLYRISRAKLRLAIGHPDEAGGLGFVGSLQATFGTLIFAWGLVVLADALNQITRFTPSPTLYVSVGAFVVFAPLLFMSPLLMFTKKIYDARQEGHVHYQILLTQFTIAFEQKHLGQPVAGEEALAQMEALAGLARIETLHAHLAKMRIVPFDLVSLGHLGLSAVTPMLPLLLRVIPWPEVRHLAESLLARH